MLTSKIKRLFNYLSEFLFVNYDHLNTNSDREKIDSQEYEQWVKIDDASLFIGNIKWQEHWIGISVNQSRMARITEAPDGSYRLNAYIRADMVWQEWEGPSVMESAEEAVRLAEYLLERK